LAAGWDRRNQQYNWIGLAGNGFVLLYVFAGYEVMLKSSPF
jgi:hypothetical protein